MLCYKNVVRKTAYNIATITNPILLKNLQLCKVKSNIHWLRSGFSRSSMHGDSWDASLKEDGDEEIDDIINKSIMRLGDSHNVFVLQPDILAPLRPMLMMNTTPQLQLAETVALVETLPGWKVSGKMILPTRTPEEIKIFSVPRMEKLCAAVNDAPGTTAIFLSLDRINGLQKKYVMKETRVDNVFDRYTLVLEIFRLRAKTKQAKLQVALAELPYLRSNKKADISSQNRQGRGSGPGETPLELLIRRFRFREQKIKQKLVKLRRNRTEHRESRKRNQIPVVAVVGYTNAGKTTLIKALSGSDKIEPKNHLFATLDVTAHAALSSGNMKFLLVDTVGFLSNLPHTLIDAFSATMEDMLQADLILHVSDVSHPDYRNQKKNVYKVLSDLDLPENLLENMIEVQNKIDLLQVDRIEETSKYSQDKPMKYSKRAIKMKRHHLNLEPSSVCRVSATEGAGIEKLMEALHERLVTLTGSGHIRIRVPAEGDYLDWLNEYASVVEVEADGDYHLIITVTISRPMLNKFKAKYVRYTLLRPT